MPGATCVAALVSGHDKPSQHPGGMGVTAGNRLGVGLGGDRRVCGIYHQSTPGANRYSLPGAQAVEPVRDLVADRPQFGISRRCGWSTKEGWRPAYRLK
jgi:hypothetical protein